MDKKYVLNKPWPPWEITYQLLWLLVRSKGPPSTKHHWTCSQAQMGSKWPWLSTWGRLRTSKHTSKSNVFQRFGKHCFFKNDEDLQFLASSKRANLFKNLEKNNPPPKKKIEDQLLFLRSLSCCSFRTLKPCESVQTHLSGDLSIESYWSYGTSPDWKWPKVIQLEHVFDTPQKRLAKMLKKKRQE